MLMIALMSSSSAVASYTARSGNTLDGKPLGPRGTSRDSRQGECMPLYQSCTPASGLVPVDFIAHVAQIDDVALVPQTRRVPGILVRFRMDRAELGANDTPAAFGLHTAKARLSARALRAVPGAVGCLPEAIAADLRPEADRLEENVVLWISCHQTDLSGNALQAMGAGADSVPPDKRRVHCRPLPTQRSAARSSHG